MKILHIGWWMKPFRYGGAINATITLMQRQMEMGHDVFYFGAGRYNLLARGSYVKHWIYKGIPVFELVNSPNLIAGHGNPAVHCENAEIEDHYIRLLKRLRPDIVHIQELEGLCGSLVRCSKKMNIPVVFFLRNYWMLCPQRDLIDMEGKVCHDFHNGLKCVTCRVISGPPKLGWMILGYTRRLFLWPLVDRFLELGRNVYKTISRDRPSPDTGLRMAFRKRREAMVEALKQADLPVPISTKTMSIFKAHGLEHPGMRVIPSTSNAVDIIRPKKNNPGILPVTFGFTGGINYHKGLHILIRAFRKLPKDKCRLLIFGKRTEPEYFGTLKKEAKGFHIEFKKEYALADINAVLEQIDIGVIPSIWEEAYGLVGQEFLAARIPIIGSRIGGIPDYLVDNINGFFAAPGDIEDWADKMKRFVEQPELIAKFQSNIKKPLTTTDYCYNIIKIYENLISKSRIGN